MLLLLLLLIQPQTTQNTYTKTKVQFTPSRTQLALCVFSATNTHKFRPRVGDATKPASIRKWRANSMRSTINKTQKKIVNQEKKNTKTFYLIIICECKRRKNCIKFQPYFHSDLFFVLSTQPIETSKWKYQSLKQTKRNYRFIN